MARACISTMADKSIILELVTVCRTVTFTCLKKDFMEKFGHQQTGVLLYVKVGKAFMK